MVHNKTAVFVAAFALAGLTASTMLPVRAEVLEQILVKVNGELFTKTDLEARQVLALRQTGQDIDLKSAAADAQIRKMLDEITPELMVNVIDEMLLVQRGRELGYRMSDEQFNTTVDRLKKDNNIANDEQFQAALKQEGMTLTDLRRNLERQMVVQYVRQNQILSRIAVADDELREYYKAHVNEFTTPQNVSLREIFVSVAGETAAAEQAARTRADSIRARLAAGESFDKLAAELSDAPSKANGGLIGPFSLEELSAELRKLVEGLKPGEFTPVLRSGRGFQLLKLETLTAAQIKPYDQAREEIGNRVFADKQRVEFEKYIATLRKEAIIEWKSPEVRKAYEVGLATVAATTPGQTAKP